MNYQYSYLIGSLLLLIVWLILFLIIKNKRKEIFIISIFPGIVAVFTEFICIIDWWHPLTITNTPVGIEDFIFGFSVGGISLMFYELFFSKKIISKSLIKSDVSKIYKIILFILLSFFIVLFLIFFILKFSFFISSIVSFIITTIYLWFKDHALIYRSILAGLPLAFILLIMFFVITEYITPGWIRATWSWENLSGLTILKAPIEDLIWCFPAGIFFSSIYGFWRNRID